MGGDAGRLTVPNILQHYADVAGQSVGAHPIRPHRCAQDGLNAAVSGATAQSLPRQAEALVAAYRNLTAAEKQGWALLNVAVGANDIVRSVFRRKLIAVRVLRRGRARPRHAGRVRARCRGRRGRRACRGP